MQEQLINVRHDYIRYANCWEDADVLLDGLNVQQDDRVLSIGSAGDNSFSLLVNNPELVVAVDINPIQLNLIELKKSAITTLDHSSFLEFLGFKESSRRLDLFDIVKKHLATNLQQFWENRKEDIENGIIYQGKLERYFILFHSKILPFIHSKKRIDRLFAEKSLSQQKIFFYQHWNSWRWKTLFKVFFSNYVMGKFGRDPAFLKEVNVSVGSFILGQAEKHLSSIECQKNYLLNYILKGEFGSFLPHYARKANFEIIKNNIEKLTIFSGLAEDAFQQYAEFNKFNLSNIFEYMSPELFKTVAKNLVEYGAEKATYAYWNLMVPRDMTKAVKHLKKEEDISKNLSKNDKGFFYSNFNVDIKL
ncbi:MAG: BtaA family protein [Cyclobacteriaceae bacterium]|nr:BtaA family protein [Cyclobacteriaceae bacterium]